MTSRSDHTRHGGDLSGQLRQFGRIFGNVFYRAYQAVFIGGGRNNIVSNNLFIECDKPVHLDNRGFALESLSAGRTHV